MYFSSNNNVRPKNKFNVNSYLPLLTPDWLKAMDKDLNQLCNLGGSRLNNISFLNHTHMISQVIAGSLLGDGTMNKCRGGRNSAIDFGFPSLENPFPY